MKSPLCWNNTATFLPAWCCAGTGTSYGCLSVSLLQVDVLSKGINGLIWFVAWRLLSTSPTLCFKEIQVSAKIRVLASGPTLLLHPFNGPLSGTTGRASTRKVKPIWILLKQETVRGSSISWAICKSAPRSRQITMPAPHH